MSIIYACIAKDKVILTSFSTQQVEALALIDTVLAKMDSEIARKTVAVSEFCFHYVHLSQGLMVGTTFLCLASKDLERQVAFQYLEDLVTAFKEAFPSGSISVSFNTAHNDKTKLQSILKSKMEASNKGKSRISSVQQELSAVQSLMASNIDKVLERGDHIDTLVGKTEALSQASFGFKKRATALRRSMWWKNTKLTIIMGLVGFLSLYFLIGIGCGLPGFHYCFHKE